MSLEPKLKPKLIVFDLDYTLWPFWVDTHVDPPFKKDKLGNIVDRRGRTVNYFQEVPEVLEKLHTDGYVLAIASRTGEIDGANQLLKLFGWEKYFKYKEIYPACKIMHFNQFKDVTGYEFEDMLFFDDENRNIRDLSSQGVTSILVEEGITWKVVDAGLKTFAKSRSK